jgi:hypothetical protein
VLLRCHWTVVVRQQSSDDAQLPAPEHVMRAGGIYGTAIRLLDGLKAASARECCENLAIDNAGEEKNRPCHTQHDRQQSL